MLAVLVDSYAYYFTCNTTVCAVVHTYDIAQNSAAARGMATEKQIMMRINATKNISKITQSMKMVSAAKLRGDQARLAQAQPFNVSLYV